MFITDIYVDTRVNPPVQKQWLPVIYMVKIYVISQGCTAHVNNNDLSAGHIYSLLTAWSYSWEHQHTIIQVKKEK
jgi:hypothetical protein